MLSVCVDIGQLETELAEKQKRLDELNRQWREEKEGLERYSHSPTPPLP